MIGKFKVAHLIGSTKFHQEKFRYVEMWLTKKGYICFAPVIYNLEGDEDYLDMLDDMCTAKLEECDIVVLITPEYVGESTMKRLQQAEALGKGIYAYLGGQLTPWYP